MSMPAEIRRLMHAEPFIPFTVHTADGKALRVPTVDHVAVVPDGSRIFVFGDADDYDTLSPRLVARISLERGASASVPNE